MKFRVTVAAAGLSAAFLFATGPIPHARAADAFGTWFTGDKESQVKIVNCGGALTTLLGYAPVAPPAEGSLA